MTKYLRPQRVWGPLPLGAARQWAMPRAFLCSAPLALLLAVVPLRAQQDPLVTSGFDHFYNLEYDDALADFNKEIAKYPDNPDGYNHRAQCILYSQMYRSGALESQLVSGSNPFLHRVALNPTPAGQQIFNDSITTAIALAQTRIKIDPEDEKSLYALGVSHGLRANYAFLVHKAWVDALRDAGTARKLHSRITAADPDFVDAELLQGLYSYIVGNLSFGYRLMGMIAGFHGDKSEGIATLHRVMEKGHWNRSDAAILLAVIYRRERHPSQAIPLLENLVEQFARNHLLLFEMVQMYGEMGDKKKALETLTRIEELKTGGAFKDLPWERILYVRGNFRFWYNDLDLALGDLEKVVDKANDMDLNTGVMAWMRIGQIHDLKEERTQATAAYKRAIAFAPGSDPAHESKNYLKHPYHRKAS